MIFVKAILLRMSALILVLMTLIMCYPAFAAANEYGDITVNNTDMYKEANEKSDVLFVLTIDSVVKILYEDAGFYRVLYENTVGYIKVNNVFVNAKGIRTAYVMEDGVNLRGAPGQSTYIIKKLDAGQPVKVKNLIGNWYFILVGDDMGYVHSSYLLISKAKTSSMGRLLKVGMEGQEVKRLQAALYDRGFLNIADITGLFGLATRQAVKDFQEACSFKSCDGIAGDETLNSIYDANNTITQENALFNKLKGTVELLDWFKGGSDWLYRYSYFTITDVKTGLSFHARRFGGWYHADSEPVTAADTAIMKQMCGSWTWDRRPIWVTLNGRTVAASMHCMPHMANPTQSNNFDGHFCIHLFHSKVHENSKECPRHQACVWEAYNAGKAG